MTSEDVDICAVSALQQTFSSCPTLSTYFTSNDKTPLKDEQIYYYSDDQKKKSDYSGSVPVQIKGKTKLKKNKKPYNDFEVDELRAYMKDGGCLAFIVGVDAERRKATQVFYAALTPSELAKHLKGIRQNQTKRRVTFEKFPTDSPDEMTDIVRDFALCCKKEMECADKTVYSLDELQDVRSFSHLEFVRIVTSAEHRNNASDGLFGHPFHGFANVPEIGGKVMMGQWWFERFSEHMNRPVRIGDREYFDSSTHTVREGGFHECALGPCVTISWRAPQTEAIDVSCSLVYNNAAGTLSDRLNALDFIEALSKGRSKDIGFSNDEQGDQEGALRGLFEMRTQLLALQKLLQTVGVSADLDCASLTDADYSNIQGLARAFLDHEHVGLNHIEKDAQGGVGCVSVADATIFFMWKRENDGKYSLKLLEEAALGSQITIGPADLTARENGSVYFLLNKAKAFAVKSNLNFENIANDVCSKEMTAAVAELAQKLLLNMLNGYDMADQEAPDSKLLAAARRIAEALYAAAPEREDRFINKLQVERRQGSVWTMEDERRLASFLAENETDVGIQWAAAVLLGRRDFARTLWETMSPEQREWISAMPISLYWHELVGSTQDVSSA